MKNNIYQKIFNAYNYTENKSLFIKGTKASLRAFAEAIIDTQDNMIVINHRKDSGKFAILLHGRKLINVAADSIPKHNGTPIELIHIPSQAIELIEKLNLKKVEVYGTK